LASSTDISIDEIRAGLVLSQGYISEKNIMQMEIRQIEDKFPI